MLLRYLTYEIPGFSFVMRPPNTTPSKQIPILFFYY